jgi:hypothetical protein
MIITSVLSVCLAALQVSRNVSPLPGQPLLAVISGLIGFPDNPCRWVVPAFWGPVLGASIIRCLFLPDTLLACTMAAFSTGVVLWQLLEYCIHRHLFHIVPRSYWAITWHFAFHGCHHKYPRDKERLVFPPAPAILVALAIYIGVHAALPQVRCSFTIPQPPGRTCPPRTLFPFQFCILAFCRVLCRYI